MNQQLAKLMTGYRDLVDRYGTDDPLAQDLQAEIDRYQQTQHDARPVERRQSNTLADAWNRHSAIASL